MDVIQLTGEIIKEFAATGIAATTVHVTHVVIQAHRAAKLKAKRRNAARKAAVTRRRNKANVNNQ